MKKIFYAFYIAMSFNFVILSQQNSNIQVGVEEKLGVIVPDTLKLIESTGEIIGIGSIIDKPTLLALVYYECPSICNPMLMNLGMMLEKVGLKHGEDFQVLTVSFSPYENHFHAKKWKKQFYNSFKKQIPENAWRFFVADTGTIKVLTETVGFKYIETEDKNFSHSAVYIALSPQRKVTRYLYGMRILPFDIKMAMIEAREGRETPTVNRFLEYCFSYDPVGQKYAFNFTKVFGTIILIFSFILLTIMYVYEKKRKAGEKK
jgi:protein SCO1/2